MSDVARRFLLMASETIMRRERAFESLVSGSDRRRGPFVDNKAGSEDKSAVLEGRQESAVDDLIAK